MINKGCEECGKRLPARNNQVNFDCQRKGLCRKCYEKAYLACREYLPPRPGSQLVGCSGKVPQREKLPNGKTDMEALACRALHLCRKCYRERFPIRKTWNLPENRYGSEKVLTPSERRHIERSQFEYMEIWLWEPEFYYEWLDAFYD